MIRTTIPALLALAPLSALAQIPRELLVDTAKNIQNELASTDRYKILTSDEDFSFDFANPPTSEGVAIGQGGRSVAAGPNNFPLLTGLGMSMTLGFLGPCGLNTPHTHPRAAEFNIAINGTLRTGLIAENGARLVMHDLKPLEATIFQAGAIHFEQNDNCEPALFVAAFNDEDPGVSQVAQRFFSLPQDILAATFNGKSPDNIIELANSIPDNIALGADECLKRCGINRPGSGGRVGADDRKLIAAPAPSVSGRVGPGQPASTGSSSTAKGSSGSSSSSGSGSKGGAEASSDDASGILGSAKNNAAAVSDDSSSSPRSSDSGLRPFLIALCAINGVLLLALAGLAAWVVWGRPRRTGRSAYPYTEGHEKEVLYSPPRTPGAYGKAGSPRAEAYDPPMDK